MDDIVRQAMAKWPNVPDCYGWLGLDTRGNWYMRDDRAQSLGAFASGAAGAKGSLLQHDKLIAFIKRYVPKSVSPMCGNTIGQDRRFLVKYMPRFEGWFHYRNIDVSTLKELARRWRPELVTAFKKKQAHTALADVNESIEELAHYRSQFLRVPGFDVPTQQ